MDIHQHLLIPNFLFICSVSSTNSRRTTLGFEKEIDNSITQDITEIRAVFDDICQVLDTEHYQQVRLQTPFMLCLAGHFSLNSFNLILDFLNHHLNRLPFIHRLEKTLSNLYSYFADLTPLLSNKLTAHWTVLATDIKMLSSEWNSPFCSLL